MCVAAAAGMHRPLIASLFLVTLTSACHGVVDVQETSTGPGGSGAGGSTGKPTAGDAGSSPFTGTGNGGSGGETGTDTGTTGDTGTTSSLACVPPGAWPSGAMFATSTFEPYLSVWSVAVDPDGNPILAGTFLGDQTIGGVALSQVGGLDPLSPDVFLAKLDPCGNALWAKAYGTASFDLVRGLDVTPTGDILFVREVQLVSGSRILKLDPNGNELWERTAEGFNVAGMRGIAAAPDGGAVLVGQAPGTFDMGNGPLSGQPEDAVVVRLDASGQALWTVWANFPGSVQRANAIVSPAGETIVTAAESTGFDAVKLDAAGQALWTYGTTGDGYVDTIELGTDSAGDLYVGGRYFFDVEFGLGNPDSGGKVAAFLLKLSGATGEVAWANTMAPLDDWSQVWDPQFTVTPGGKALFVANYHGHYDVAGMGTLPDPGNGDIVGPVSMLFAGFEADGSLSWLATNGTLSGPWLGDAALAPDGSTLVAQALGGSVVLADGTVLDGAQDGIMALLRVAP